MYFSAAAAEAVEESGKTGAMKRVRFVVYVTVAVAVAVVVVVVVTVTAATSRGLCVCSSTRCIGSRTTASIPEASAYYFLLVHLYHIHRHTYMPLSVKNAYSWQCVELLGFGVASAREMVIRLVRNWIPSL
jgi:hypothetical protein